MPLSSSENSSSKSLPQIDMPSSISQRISCLHHKFGNDTMENHALVIATRMPNEALHRFW
ncbi:hypothetical protein SCLCIDRAFT_1220592 [Scleroderma citrinum Foug A]|uniref:Uncharacterized protein n=1 Tax=Scleroderma citrinum Foug A TaxID=1036808 RepID=A0A0C2ZUC4_9AGAM|nr:hypothetical protein SCLCIDRAFT_1220592 [Scleroderma citrinum Foug A]